MKSKVCTMKVIFQKRILSIVSGAILPIVALGFIKSLVDYIKPEEEELKKEEEDIEETDQTPGLLVDGGGSLTPVSAQTVEETESINEVAPTTEELNSEQEEPQGEEPSEEVTGEELPQIETVEHNGGQVVITEQRLLPKMVEMPSASINPTRL